MNRYVMNTDEGRYSIRNYAVFGFNQRQKPWVCNNKKCSIDGAKNNLSR